MKKIIDLGMHPYADTFISKDQVQISEPVYPLQCMLDEVTGHISLKYETSSDERYNLYDYSYTSANSKFSRDHWDSFASDVSNNIFWETTGKILEIGSNDGYLCQQFKSIGHNVIGIDPSRKMKELAKERDVTTLCRLFNYDQSCKINKAFGKFDLVVANNVFNHANDPIDFALGVKNILTDKGVFVFEVPYWYNTIKDKRFDQIYHEHPSYFTVKSSFELLKQIGLYVYDVRWVDYHGGSIRVFAKKSDNKSADTIVQEYIDKETKLGLFDVDMYKKFMQDITKSRNQFLKKIYSLDTSENPIIGIGAAAKANTFLNFYNLDSSVIKYITDTSEHKKGKYTPLTRIPIVEDEILSKYKEPYVLILSWNISHILKDILKKINPNIRFINLDN